MSVSASVTSSLLIDDVVDVVVSVVVSVLTSSSVSTTVASSFELGTPTTGAGISGVSISTNGGGLILSEVPAVDSVSATFSTVSDSGCCSVRIGFESAVNSVC